MEGNSLLNIGSLIQAMRCCDESSVRQRDESINKIITEARYSLLGFGSAIRSQRAKFHLKRMSFVNVPSKRHWLAGRLAGREDERKPVIANLPDCKAISD